MNLRSLVMRGGAYMSLRMLVGLVLSFGGVILLTRTIGPGNYGLYAAALGLLMFIQKATQGGIRAYLVRQEGEERDEIYHQAFTLMLVLSVGVTLVLYLGLPVIEGWVRLDRFGPVALAMFMSLPVALLAKVPLARLERALDFRHVAILELSGLATFYLVSVSLAFAGFGVMSPVVGWWAQQVLMSGYSHYAARYLPRLHWDRGLAKSMIGYGMSFSASNLLFQLRELINPLVVARYLGADAAGYVALASRLVMGLGFMKETAWRLSIPALARLQRDTPRMIRAVTEGMQLQLLALATPLVGFGLVSPWLLPAAFGEDWTPVTVIYPFIALGALSNALFTMHSSALYALRHNLSVAVFNLSHIVLFAGSAFLLVPSVGLLGYGLAEVIALTSYTVVHYSFARKVGNPAYLLTGVWWGAAALALFAHDLGWWAVPGVAFAVLWPGTWRKIGGYSKAMWNSRKVSQA